MPHGLQVPWTEDTPGCTFNVYRNTVNDFSSSTQIATNLSASPFTDTTGVGGTPYWYWTTAVLGGIESGPSNAKEEIFPTTPDPPVDFNLVIV